MQGFFATTEGEARNTPVGVGEARHVMRLPPFVRPSLALCCALVVFNAAVSSLRFAYGRIYRMCKAFFAE